MDFKAVMAMISALKTEKKEAEKRREEMKVRVAEREKRVAELEHQMLEFEKAFARPSRFPHSMVATLLFDTEEPSYVVIAGRERGQCLPDVLIVPDAVLCLSLEFVGLAKWCKESSRPIMYGYVPFQKKHNEWHMWCNRKTVHPAIPLATPCTPPPPSGVQLLSLGVADLLAISKQ